MFRQLAATAPLALVVAGLFFPSLVEAKTLGPEIRAVYPERIQVGTVIEVLGRGFTAQGDKPRLSLVGRIHQAGGAHPVRLDVPLVFESSKRLAYRVRTADFEKIGRRRGWFAGRLTVTCPVGGGRVEAATRPVRFRLFPPGIQAAAEAVLTSGALPQINAVLTWVILALLWLAFIGVAARVILFRPGRPSRPGAGASPADWSRFRAWRLPAFALWFFVIAGLGAGAWFAAPYLHGALNAIAGIGYVVHLGLGLLVAVVFVVVGLLYAGPITWVERRVAARMQSRVGPNRVGPQGLLQWLADGLKAVQKEDIIPAKADPPLFRFAPYLMFAAIFATFAVLPFSATWAATDLNVGVLFLVSITSLVVPSLIMAGWSSNNKWSLFGGMRAAAQIISYEIPASLALLTVILYAGSLSMQDLVRTQGGAPWNWFIFHNPFTFVAFFLFFTSSLAEGNRAPFDLPEAESELVSGYNTEYSGMRFLMFFVGEYVNILVMSAISTAVFLGGWRVPMISVVVQEQSFSWQLVGLALFLAKVSVLSFIVIWLRWTLPRLRVDQLMTMCWKYFVPITLMCFLGSALWYLAFSHLGIASLVVRVGLFLAGMGLVSFLLYRAWWHFKHTKAEVYANPFL